MEVDSTFVEPIKIFHKILRVVEMPPEELMQMLPLRINNFSFVRYPHAEPYGFPIDLPDIKGSQLVKLYVTLIAGITIEGANAINICTKDSLAVTNPMYNTFECIDLEGQRIYRLVSKHGKEPVVLYRGKLVDLRIVEQHIQALAIYCNHIYNKSASDSTLLKLLPTGYKINKHDILIVSGELHDRLDLDRAKDALYSCILNYMRL